MIHDLKRRSSQARGKAASERRQARRKRSLLFERLEARYLLAADWQNPLFNLDVNDDAHVSAIDALLIINSLNSFGSRELTEPFDNDSAAAAYWDVNGDGFIAPSDSLALINDLNEPSPLLPVSLALAHDSGASATDGVTIDSQVLGQVLLGGASTSAARLRVNREGVLPLSLDAEGRFEIEPQLLSSFAEGAAKVGIYVSTASGARALSGLRLTLDATPPLSPTVASFSADTGVLGDGITTDDTLQITGSAEPGVRVNVFFNGSSQGTMASAPDGSWSFAAPSQDDGEYTITAVAEDAAGNASPASSPLVVTISSGQLGGPADDPANEHIPDVYFPDAPAGDLTLDNRPEGTWLETSRTRLMVQFTNTATVGEVNALLESLEASIIGAMSAIDLVLISIPDTGDFTGLDSALAILESDPAVALVVQDVALGVSSVPGPTGAQDPGPPAIPWLWNSPPSTINGNDLDGNWGLEAVRAPQMWNLNDYGNRSTSEPQTGVLDAGFNDVNSDGVNDHPEGDLPGLRTWQSTDFGLVPGAVEDSHGQHVAGTIGAVFDNGVGVAGINPFVERHSEPDNHFVGVSAQMESLAATIDSLRQMLQKWPDLRVINISLGYKLPPRGTPGMRFPNANTALQREATNDGLILRQLIARYPQTLIVGSAGNDSNDGWSTEIEARWTSPWNYAGLGIDLTDENGVLWPKSPNILVVESVDAVVGNSVSPAFAWQYSKSDFSNVGGSVAAPGGQILSTMGDNLFGGVPFVLPNYATLSGTSMAAPHVTGLIGYLLTLDPTLSVEEIRTLVTDSAYTRTTVLRNNNGVDDDGDGVVDDGGDSIVPAAGPDEDGNGLPDKEEGHLPDSVFFTRSAPMIDAFAAALGIDLVTGDATKSIQRALVDVDDGSLDGNLRVDLLTDQAVTEIFTDDERRGDKQITMRDFRTWRDAYLQTIGPYLSGAELGVALDGGDHVKKDLNFNGVVAADDDHLYPRYDFNGDGSLLDWSATAPFKIDPDTPAPPPPAGVPPLHNNSTELQSSPGFLRDIDVLADPAFWNQGLGDFYDEGVTVTPGSEGGPTQSSSLWTESRYLLGNHDPDSASDFLKGVPDYIHSFDVHVSVDWTALDYGHDAVLLRIDSEMAGPNFAEHFRREAVIPEGTADFVVTIPLWTGRVEVRVAGFDRDDETLPNLDQASPRESWSSLKFGEDRALRLEARDYVITNFNEVLEAYGVTASSALAINNLGDVVVIGVIGVSPNQVEKLFLVEHDGTIADLSWLHGGGYWVDVVAINDSRQIAGTRYSEVGNEIVGRGFIYEHGETPSLIDLGADYTVKDMNNAGDVVGEHETLARGFLRRYQDGNTVLLGDVDDATGINNLGDVVGVHDARGFLYRDGSFIDIGTPPVQGNVFVRATDINDAGLIVGIYRTGFGFGSPFFWEEGEEGEEDIWTTFPSFGWFDVRTINASGVAVGNEYARDLFSVRNWSSWMLTVSGRTNISNLNPPGSPFHSDSHAGFVAALHPVNDINDRGDMVGYGMVNYPYSAGYLLRRVL
jgi:probable HAF family extracellular repeat protein